MLNCCLAAGFIAVFITATALFLPAQPFVVATGYLFGFHFCKSISPPCQLVYAPSRPGINADCLNQKCAVTILFTVAVYALAAFLMFNGARYWFRPIAEAWLREHKVNYEREDLIVGSQAHTCTHARTIQSYTTHARLMYALHVELFPRFHPPAEPLYDNIYLWSR
jgi:hypothetical protein